MNATTRDVSQVLKDMESAGTSVIATLGDPAPASHPVDELRQAVSDCQRYARDLLSVVDADRPLTPDVIERSEAVLRAALAAFPFFHKTELALLAGANVPVSEPRETFTELRRNCLAATIAIQKGLGQAYRTLIPETKTS